MGSRIRISYFDESLEGADQTYKLLHEISNHLSYREEFRGKEYSVELGDNKVRINGTIPYVFQDNHSRKSQTKIPLVEHVLKTHMGAKSVKHILSHTWSFKGFKVVPGVYKYKCSLSNKTRKWFSIF